VEVNVDQNKRGKNGNMYILLIPRNVFCSEYQFVYPGPPVGGSELIVSAPFRTGVIRENQFAD
jgi:hypothetical protein